MRFLVDPSQVVLGAASWLFLAVVCLLLPWGAIRQHRSLATDPLPVTRVQIYASALFTHVALLALVWAVVREQRIDLIPAYHPTPLHLLIGLVALGLGLLPIVERFRVKDQLAEQRTRLIAPRARREYAFFYAVAVSAGIVEELAYRGVLFILLASVVRSWWLAAIAGAAIFGIVHLFQGWKSAGVAALVGLRDQIVVGLTGTLLIPIVVHTVHDVIAGTVIGIRARREDKEVASLALP